MDVKIQRKSGFKIAGISAQGIETSLCNDLCNDVWKSCFQNAVSKSCPKWGVVRVLACAMT